EYEHEAEARWEQLTVLFSRFASREEARDAISQMGTEAFYGGSMKAVAISKSQEPFAADGGVHDWTPKGSLRSKVIDKNVFTLPLNRMSPILEDEEGFHIIRVLERKEAGVTPLAEVQEEIKKKLQTENMMKQQETLMAELASKVPVWSFFPADTPGAKPLPAGVSRKLR
ncbi:MAG: peptidylprolyl isomerase, partial [Planctomycetota bacterium]